MFRFNPSLDVLYTQSEMLRKVRDEKRLTREAQLRRQLSEVIERDSRRKRFGWGWRPFYPAGA